jgi:tripartite-type tricarboxylate transporter receptor subunit TctC
MIGSFRPVQRFGAIALAFAASVLAPAQAQDFPSRPLRIIVPYGTGTGVDIVARQVAGPLSERIKQQVIVENRPGGSAIIGVTALKQAAPDGYTIGILVSANAAQPWLIKDIPFDIRKDFVPLTLLYSGPLVLTVTQSFPAKNLAELVAYAKANPGKLNYGSLGIGTTTHLAAELLKQVAGIDGTNVSYKGSADIHNAVAAGDVQMSFDNYVSPRPLVDAGRLRPIATTSLTRMPALPNVPTLAETYPGVEMAFWTGFAAPPGTPPAIVERLTAELRAVLQSPDLKRRMAETGSEIGGTTPAEFARRIETDYEKFGKLIRGAGIKPE